MSTNWNRKDLLGLRELSANEINFILETADAFKQVGAREIKKVPALRGKTLINFFVEPSTRTRTSFELAAHRLSADVMDVGREGLEGQESWGVTNACAPPCSVANGRISNAPGRYESTRTARPTRSCTPRRTGWRK